MDGVEAAGFFFGKAHGFDGHDFEAGFDDSRQDFTLQIAADGIRLDDRKRAFRCHERILHDFPSNTAGAKPGVYNTTKPTA